VNQQDSSVKPSPLIFACSGAADVGAMADLAARKLQREGVGKMYCLAGIGGGVAGIIDTVKAATEILLIDGCPVDCAKKTFDKTGIGFYKYLRITDLGFQKGKSVVSEQAIDTVVQKCRESLVHKSGKDVEA
jgi:uncharacterized metal-binding protein